MLYPDETFLPAAIELASTAKTILRVSTFKAEITSKPRGRKLLEFFEVLFAKAEAGVDVQFLMNWQRAGKYGPYSNRYAIRHLKKRGVDVRYLPNDRCAHAKVIIPDVGPVLAGSHNLSTSSCHKNYEISQLVEDPYHIQQFILLHDHVWLSATPY